MTNANPDPDELIALARRLDPQALAQIHDQFYPQVYRYVRYRLNDIQACEDITSEVFLRLLAALHKRGGPTSNLRGWLFGTASNLVNDHFRQHYKRKGEFSTEKADDILIDHSSLEISWETKWQRQEVRAAFSQLTSEQQHVLALRFADEYSLEETATIVGKSVTAVKALQFRALASLRRFLENKKDR